MSFSVNLISLPSEAEALIKMAQRDKRTLEHRLDALDIRSENSVESLAEHGAELIAVTAALSAADALIATLPEGELKENQITKKMELELRLRKLNKSGNKDSVMGTLEREYDSDQMEKQISGTDNFIAEVTARQAAL